MNITKNLRQIAKAALINAADAVENLTNYIANDFEACVREIIQSRAGIVLKSAGKNGVIAYKLWLL